MSEIKSVAHVLPEQPSLENLKKRARALLEDARSGDREAQARVLSCHPALAKSGVFEGARFSLSAAQLVIAREYGFASWAKLKAQLVVQRARAALVVPMGAALPLLDLSDRVLCPYSTLHIAIDHDVSARAVDAALGSASGYALCISHLQGGRAMGRVGAIALVTKSRGVNGVDLVRLRYQGRARVTRQLDHAGHSAVEVSPWAELGLSRSDTLASVEQLYRLLEPVARRVEWLSTSDLARFQRTGDLAQLVSVAVTQCNSTQKRALLEARDQRAMALLLCDVLEGLLKQPPETPRTASDPVGTLAEPPACLVVLAADRHPHLVGRRYLLGQGSTSIGRAADNAVCLPSDAISRSHSRIELDGADFVLVDQRSTNGTFVAGVGGPVSKHVLSDSDRITLGDAILVFLRGEDLTRKYRDALACIEQFDPLTGARTAHAWRAETERLVWHARGAAAPLGLLVLELDPLAALTERSGALAGNALLAASAELLRRDLPKDAIFGRCEGNHFAITLPGCDVREACRVAEALRLRCADQQLGVRGEGIRATSSIGVSALERNTGVAELWNDALAALGHARRSGRNAVAGPPAAAA